MYAPVFLSGLVLGFEELAHDHNVEMMDHAKSRNGELLSWNEALFSAWLAPVPLGRLWNHILP